MLFWLLVFTACFGMCLWLMTIHWMRYESRPTVTTIKTTAYPISNIPFPAVTVCNSNTVYKKNTKEIRNSLMNMGIDNETIDDFLKNLKYLITPTDMNTSKFTNLYTALDDLDMNVDTVMANLMHPCGNMLVDCHWSGRAYNCSELFKPSKTGLGYCCSFNLDVDLKEVKHEEEEDLEVAVGSGVSYGLLITVNINPYNYVSKIYPYYAAIILVHPNWEFADSSAFSVSVQEGDFVLMQITPTVFNSEDNLHDVSVDKRGCWFEHEGYLESSNDYSFKNCIIECKARAIYKLCECIPYFYPLSSEYVQCTLLDVPCLKKYEMIYNNIQLSGDKVGNYTTCDCLPQCQDINYDGYLNAAKDSMQNKYAVVQIFYQHSWCVEYMKSLNMSWDMLLASLGGIFGLCLGGSLISLIELIYYFLEALCRTLLQNKKVSQQNITPAKVKMVTNNFYYPN